MPGWLRLLFGAAVGLGVGLGLGLLPGAPDGVSRGLVGWCSGAAVYLLPRVARIVPDGEPARTSNALLRGYESLPVRIRAA